MEKVKNRIDLKLLNRVLAIQSHYTDDSRMMSFIKSELSDMNVTVQEDEYGNIYATKGISNDYPCLVAHTDTVHFIRNNFSIYRNGDILFAFDVDKKKQTGIGGDDKVGVYILLQALTDLDNVKAVFYRHEENGGHGSHFSMVNHKDWYENCNFVIQPDRRGTTDIISSIERRALASIAFLDDIKPIYENYGYKITSGIFSDVFNLTLHQVGVSCINMSCGYLDPHTSTETVSIAGVNVAYNIIFEITTKFNHKRYPWISPEPVALPTTVGPTSKTTDNYFKEYKNKNLNLFDQKEIDVTKYGSLLSFENFQYIGNSHDNKKKLYRYIGFRALPLDITIKCDKCKDIDSLYYLPHEGRMYCINCRKYLSIDKTQSYLKYVSVVDSGETFVYVVLASYWLNIKDAVWDDKLQSWVPNTLPF